MFVPKLLSAKAERKLLEHSWPGNIRELENSIHHALLVCRNQRVAPADLHLVDMRSPGIRHEQEQAVQAGHAVAGPVDLEAALNALFEQNIPDLYEHIEETIFRAAYRFCHGNQLQTGRLLNISRNIVRARLEKIGELNKPLSVGES